MIFSRKWAMPNHNTFEIKPIREFVLKYTQGKLIRIDPFARNNKFCNITNDLNPETTAEHHLDCPAFLDMLIERGILANIVVFDPPYSARQTSECYKQFGYPVTMETTQTNFLCKNRERIDKLVKPGGIVLNFGWNSVGMGKKMGYEILEILLVAHGGAHNDTICVAERKLSPNENTLFEEQ